MKQLNWFRFKGQTPRSAGVSATNVVPDVNYGGKLGAILAAGLFLVFAIAVGCSKERSKTASNQFQAVPAPSAPAVSTAAAVQPTPVLPPSPEQTPKKVVKKRPANVTYSDERYGVSFLYPRKYALKTGEKVKQDTVASESMDFVQPGGMTVAAVDVPKGFYPGTDLALAYFQVNVNQNMTPTECEQFASPEPNLFNMADQPAKISVGEMQLQEVEDIRGQQDEQADAKFYHVYKNGACYEFALGMRTAAGESEDSAKPVDRDQVFRGLEKILASVKIKMQDTPETAATATVTTSQEAATK